LNSQNILRVLFILLLVTIVATTQPSSAIVPDKGPSASGKGRVTFSAGQIDFSFHAKENKNGKENGLAQFDNLSAQTHVVVKINCVNITPFVGTMSGTVLHSDDPAFPKDATVIFTATDNHPGFGDSITPLLVATFDCEFEVLGLRPLQSGDIVIEP
jgi:hypothetical protein